jgi:type III restriction enzyme
VAGGKTYSPDFAYVVKQKDGQQYLNFVVETKNIHHADGLRDEERFKIKHAERFFADTVKITFKTQFSHNRMIDLIKQMTQAT